MSTTALRHYLSTYPNPEKDLLNVEFEGPLDRNNHPEQPTIYKETSSIPALAIAPKRKFKANEFRNGTRLELDIQKLERGTYFLHYISPKSKDAKVRKIRIVPK